MEEVEVKALPLELLASILTTQRARRLAESAARARAQFGDRTIWHVNATAHGGGVAEMLQTLLAYGRGAQIENRWLVLDGEAEFFAVTKRLHNLLHGDRGDGGPLGDDERACYERVVAANVAEMLTLIGARDIVLLHDPQTAGMVDGLRASGVRVVWRCHVGRDTCNDETDEAWAFLRPYIERADAFVFSREEYVPEWVERERLVIIAPSIDPFSAKNRELDPPTVSAILTTAGLLTGADPAGPVHFERRDGSQGTVRQHTGLIADGEPPPHDAAARGAGEPMGSAQGHGRRARGFRHDGRRRSRRRPPHARRAGRVRGDRRSRGRRRARRVPCPMADRPRVDPRACPPRLDPDG